MAGYTRQSTFADGDTITAALFNNEYNQLVNAFSNTSGHSHDGTAASGPVIGLIGDAGETSPNNKVLIDTTNNYIEFYVEVSSAPVQQLYIADGAIIPVTDSDIDLGTTSLRFKDTYTDTITTTGNATIGGNLTVTGNATISGNLTFGDANTDSINLAAEIDSHIVPNTDDTYDLGTSTKEWRNLYIDGTANIDSLIADTADINGGTIDGATIATSDITVGSGKTLNVSAGTLTLADNQISGDKVEGGTIAATTITDLTFGSLNDGTITITAFADEDDMSSDSATLVPTQQSVKAYVDSQVTAQDLDFQGDSGGALSIDLDSESLTIAGGTGLDTVGSGNTVTVNIDATVATLTGSQTLTNKTIDVDNNTVSNIEVDNLKSGVLDTDLTSVAATDTTIASAKAIKTYVDAQVTAQDLDFAGDTGGALSIDLDSESLTIAGGTGIDTSGASNTLTVNIDSTVATLTGTQTLTNKTLTSPVINTGVSGTAFLDDDTFGTASATTLASSESIKAYVDTRILTEDTLAELNDTNITSPADGALLFYDTGTSMWIDNVVSGDITIADTGVAAISSGVIVNDDINASAAISISKTALVGGTGLTLTGDTLSVDAAQTQITSVGTLGSLTVSGDLTVDTNTLKVDSTNNRVGIGNATPDVSLDVGSNTDAIHVPSGTTAERPTSPAAGYLRYNSTTGDFEGYTDAWGAIAGAGGTAPAIDTMTGDGSDTTLTLTSAPVNENATVVTIDGVVQHKDTYSVSSNTLTFSEAPPTGTKVECITWTNTVVNSALLVQDADGDTQIQVEESSDEDKIRFDTGGTERMIIDSTGVGIGTTSPSVVLDTRLSTTTGKVAEFHNNAGYGIGFTVADDGGVNTINSESNQALAFATNGASNERMRIDASGTVLFKSGSFPTNQDSPFIYRIGGGSLAIGAATETGTSAHAAFYTNSLERMRIDSSGNVGIGTSSISATDWGSASKILQIAGTQPLLSLKDTDVTNGEFHIANSGQNLYIWDAAATATRMIIDSSGNVGIGVTNPASGLVVSKSTSAGRGGEISIINLATSAVGNEAALNFGLEPSTYNADNGNAQIKARINNASTSATDIMFSTWNGSGFGERMRIDSSGNILVNTTSVLTPSASFANLTLDGSITVGPNLGSITPSGTISVKELGGTSMSFFYGTTKVGSITNTASATAYNTSSDGRLKDVTGSARGLEVINELNPVAYNWKESGQADEGLIAQEVLDIVPNAVSGSEEDMYQMDYSKLVVHLVAGMKEQQAQIEALQSEINELKNS